MSLFAELKRRNVIRVGIAYIIVGWVIAQVAEFAFENFGAPDWVLKSLVVVLLLGLPLALLFAWAFEMTPEGIKLEKEVDRTQSIVSQTGRKLDRTIIAVLVVALAWFGWDKFLAGGEATPPPAVSVSTETIETPVDPMIAATEDKSVAVLPFVAMSSGPDDEYFADGLTEEILNSLAQLPELLVTARTSAFSFKGQDIPIQEIAAALGVRHVVEGSVRRSGDRLRVTAQLIRADDAFHLWSENYDSTSTDTIAVQEDIAEKIAAALDVVLDERKREAMRLAGLRDVEAFTLYQKAVEAFERAHGDVETVSGLRAANVLFEQVIDQAPGFADAYIDHADLYAHILNDYASGDLDVPLTSGEAADAISTFVEDYRLASKHAKTDETRLMAEADLAFVSGNWRGLGGRIERALSEPGCYDGNWTTTAANVFGYADRYLARSYQNLKCDPRRSLNWFNSARAALVVGNKEEALQLVRDGAEVAPGAWLSHMAVRVLLANGMPDEAQKELNDNVSSASGATSLTALVSAHTGDTAGYELALEELLTVHNSNFDLLQAYAWGGNRDAANKLAAEIDARDFGPIALAQIAQWCFCGAPFDLDAAPNFAAKLEEGGFAWPQIPSLGFPLKDW